ncbi:MAG: hypothetical protein U0869_01550 [Chloroflexota bacterium]
MRIRRRVAAALSMPLLAGSLAIAPAASAQGETCGLLTAAEVDTAFAATDTVVSTPGSAFCVFSGADAPRLLLSASPGEDLTQPKADNPDGKDVTVAGDPGWFSAGGSTLAVAAPGQLLTLQAYLDPAPDPATLQSMLTGLAMLAIPRLPAGPDPAQLERIKALIPADIDGHALTTQSISGDLLVGFMDPEDPRVQALDSALAAQGLTAGDLTMVGGSTNDGSDVGIAVILVNGADATALFQPVIGAILGDQSAAPTTQVQLGGKTVTQIAGEPVLHAYASGDLIFVVNGSAAFLDTFFAGLP